MGMNRELFLFISVVGVIITVYWGIKVFGTTGGESDPSSPFIFYTLPRILLTIGIVITVIGASGYFYLISMGL